MKRPQLQSAMAASKFLPLAAALLALSITLWLHRAPQGPSTPARAVLESSPDVQAERSNAKVDPTAGWRRDPAVDAIISAFDGASQPRSDASRDAVTEGARATHSRWRDLRPERGATRVFMTLLAGVNPGLGTIAYSRDLNPRAVALTNEQIDALEIIVSRYFAHLKWVAAQSASARSRDLAECRSAGKLLPIAGWSEDARLRARIDRYLAEESDKGPRSAEMARRATQSRVRMLERLGYILITDPQAEYLYVHASDLPRLRDVLEYRFFRGEEYAFVLLAWFQANGALSAPEAEVLRASAASFREQSPILRHR